MALESTVICMDTSAWMINGDYIPNRLEAQQDAVGLLITLKLEANRESTVGLLAHGGKRVRVLMPPTDDESALLACLDGLKAGGATNVVQGVKIAMLALKHRRNKNGGQRIVLFVGSPITDKDTVLKKLGISMRRANIALDVIGLGEHEANADKIKVLVDAANVENNSSHVPIPPGVPPSDALMSSSIVTGGGAGGNANAFAQYGGVNPELDPELAMTLAASLEEMRQNTEAKDKDEAATNAANASGGGDDATASTPAPSGAPTTAPGAPGPSAAPDVDDDDDFDMDDPELRMAMMLSLQDAAAEDNAASSPAAAPAPAPAPAPAAAAPAPATDGAQAGGAATADAGGAVDVSDDFVANLLSDLPGVDQNDPSIQALMAQIREDGEGKKDDKKGGEGKKDGQ